MTLPDVLVPGASNLEDDPMSKGESNQLADDITSGRYQPPALDELGFAAGTPEEMAEAETVAARVYEKQRI